MSKTIKNVLYQFKEDTEDLWEHFMEGDNPDPQKYDDFLDSAYETAITQISELIREARVEAIASYKKVLETERQLKEEQLGETK